MPSIDIRPDHYTIVKNILDKHLPGQKIMVFGSRAKGTSTLHSDLDLCVMNDGNETLSFETLGVLREAFSLSILPYKVDLVEWSRLTPEFRELIQKDAVPLYTSLT